MTAAKDGFPFSGVVGQDEAQLALLLAAVDPGIGGVLLRGDKGSAKSTLARGLAALLAGDVPFVELPIGATEDRVIGSLDLRAALTDGADRVRPGLLAAAHGGVLYVDEVNLLPDHLVDTLLDVAASGVNRVERDGVSHEHPARFLLLGSMNPEEGELRPQLLDRFGLTVDVRTPRDPSLRAEAVRRRLAHDADAGADLRSGYVRPDAGVGGPTPGERFRTQNDQALRERLAVARPARLPGDLVAFASRLAVEVGAESLRADLVLCRSAAALAGWEGRLEATPDDVARVAPLALAHRRRRRPFDPPTLPPEDLEAALEATRNPTASREGGPPPAMSADGSTDARSQQTDVRPDQAAGPGGRDRQSVPPDARPARPGPSSGGGPPATDRRPSATTTGRWQDLAGATLSGPPPVTEPGGRPRRSTTTTTDGAGRTVGDQPLGDETAPAGLAVLPTVRAALRRRVVEPDGPVLEPDDLRSPVRQREQSRVVVLVVDASGSMGTRARVEAATGAVLGLLADAYLHRDQVALVAFRGEEAVEALSPTQSVELARSRLADLPTGGTTPLGAGIAAGTDVARRAATKGTAPLLVLLTDGRATGSPDALRQAHAAAAAVASTGIEAVVLDAEDGSPRLGLARDLAALMGARYLPLDDVTSTAVETAIRTHTR